MKKHRRDFKNSLYMCLQWPIWMSIVLIIMNIAVYLTNVRSGYIVSAVVALYLGCAIGFWIYRKKKLLSRLVEYGSDYAQIQKRLLNEMEVPYALCDEHGHLLWMNQEFACVLKEANEDSRELLQIFEEATERAFPGEQETEHATDVALNSKKYRMMLKRIDMTETMEQMSADIASPDVCLYTVYLYDTTEILRVQKLYDDNQFVVGLLYIDNFDEAQASLEDVRKSLLMALVDRKIKHYFSAYNGILNKIEKDKYLYVGTMKYLPAMKENRFHVLEEAKSVNIGNEMAVTVSIGIGIGGENIFDNYENARAAIDLALGRGGDQAVLKNNKTVEYFGGKTHSMEKSTHVKARVKAHALRELIETKEKVLIMGHSMSDVDSIGAAVGIYRAAKTSGKRAYIVLERIGPAEKPLIDRFIGNAEYEQDLFIKREEAINILNQDKDNAIVVVVDVNRPSYTECPDLLTKCKNIVVLDHHRQSDERVENPVLSYIEPYASSACEMVAEILQYYSDDLKIKPLDADAMYSGIVVDTNNFLNKTGIRTFEAAAFLRQKGADVTRVRKMFRDDMEEYRIRAKAINEAEVIESFFAMSICSADNNNNLNVLAAQTANELLNIQGIQASFVLTEFNGKIYVSARSIDEVNVQIVMERLGGGGHMSIAGAQLTDMSITQAYQLVKETVLEMRHSGAI